MSTRETERLSAFSLAARILDGVAGVRTPEDSSLESLLLAGVEVSRTNATVLRVLPALFVKVARAVNFDELRDSARARGVDRHLGMLLDLGAKLGRAENLRGVVDRLRRQHSGIAESYLNEQMGTFQRRLAERRNPPTAREWGFFVNMPEETFLTPEKLGGADLH